MYDTDLVQTTIRFSLEVCPSPEALKFQIPSEEAQGLVNPKKQDIYHLIIYHS